MSNQLAHWKQAFASAQPRFVEIAQETQVIWVQESMFASQIITANEFMQKTDPNSIRNAVINVASVGLTLNPAHSLAYLVPRDELCCLDISYRGMLKIATNTGPERILQVHVVNCDACGTQSRPRLSKAEAIKDWNNGLRKDASGYAMIVLSRKN